ncbi:MAG: hypothetical protein ACK559_27470, partial [bacterium]
GQDILDRCDPVRGACRTRLHRKIGSRPHPVRRRRAGCLASALRTPRSHGLIRPMGVTPHRAV